MSSHAVQPTTCNWLITPTRPSCDLSLIRNQYSILVEPATCPPSSTSSKCRRSCASGVFKRNIRYHWNHPIPSNPLWITAFFLRIWRLRSTSLRTGVSSKCSRHVTSPRGSFQVTPQGWHRSPPRGRLRTRPGGNSEGSFSQKDHGQLVAQIFNAGHSHPSPQGLEWVPTLLSVAGGVGY